ncbi:MAG: squalene synthase HpnC [bacterium]
MNSTEAYARCAALAKSHYENFPVGRLVGKKLRPHVHAIYAFARVADDLADEGYEQKDGAPPLTQEQRTDALLRYQGQLDAALKGQPLEAETEWIFLPLVDTARRFDLPESLFYDLLSAFQQDVVKRRYATFAEVLDYSRRSANPIGRLVLYLHGYRRAEESRLSDLICTALQLANFWQDVAVDLLKDRIYLPQEDMRKFGVSEEQLFAKRADESFRRCLEFQVKRTWELFHQGRGLPRRLKKGLGWEIRLTWLGGTAILKKIERQNYDTLTRRPKLTKWDMLRLLPWAWLTR